MRYVITGINLERIFFFKSKKPSLDVDGFYFQRFEEGGRRVVWDS